jgi:hypothetical protein
MLGSGRIHFGWVIVLIILIMFAACKTSVKHKCKDCPKFSNTLTINHNKLS